MADSHCGEGSFSSSSARLRLSDQPEDTPVASSLQVLQVKMSAPLQPQGPRGRKQLSASDLLPSISMSTEALKAKVDGGQHRRAADMRSFCVLFSPVDYVYMTLLLSNTESLLMQTKQARPYCHTLQNAGAVTSKQRTWQSPIQMAVAGKLSFFVEILGQPFRRSPSSSFEASRRKHEASMN